MDVSEYREGSRFTVASTENIVLYEGRVYRNAVSAAHASDKSALSFFASPRRSGFVKSALPLFRSVSRCSLLWRSTASYINFCSKH